MKTENWDLLILKLGNTAKNIGEDVLAKDEGKAFGELALLQRDIEQFLKKHWDQGKQSI